MEKIRAVSSPPKFGLLTPPATPNVTMVSDIPYVDSLVARNIELFRPSRSRAGLISDENQAAACTISRKSTRTKSDIPSNVSFNFKLSVVETPATWYQLDGTPGQSAFEESELSPVTPLSLPGDMDGPDNEQDVDNDLPPVFRARRNLVDQVVFPSVEAQEGLLRDTEIMEDHVDEDLEGTREALTVRVDSPDDVREDNRGTATNHEGHPHTEDYVTDATEPSTARQPKTSWTPTPLNNPWPTPPSTPKRNAGEYQRKVTPKSRQFHLALPDSTTHPDTPEENLLDTPTLSPTRPAASAFPSPLVKLQNDSLSPLAISRLRPRSPRSRSTSSSRSGSASSRADRFLPYRNFSVSSAETFRISKPLHKLTPREKLLRKSSAGPDPFQPPSRMRGPDVTGDHDLLIQPRPHFGNGPTVQYTQPSPTVLGIESVPGHQVSRQASHGAVWNVGGAGAQALVGIPDGRGGMLGSGTRAPLYKASFLRRDDLAAQAEAQERRTALAMDVDPSARVLASFGGENTPTSPKQGLAMGNTRSWSTRLESDAQYLWQDHAWVGTGNIKLLDAESLRDDFYCSVLAYSPTADCLAVGLANLVYLWTESHGVSPCPTSINSPRSAHITSLSFSSHDGGQAILAVGRADGRLALWSPKDKPHFLLQQPSPVACISFRPNVTQRGSVQDSSAIVPTEHLLVGDEAGVMYYFSVEWPTSQNLGATDWAGSVSLLAKIHAHTQTICGLAWSPEGDYFVSGGNDNCAFLFESRKIIPSPTDAALSPTLELRVDPYSGDQNLVPVSTNGSAVAVGPGCAIHRFSICAAVKALAFCPWQRGLLALGGGSNDRGIHFYHTMSGAALATIDTAAQITSLVWSTTRREICATFGFSSFPEHTVRVAVFSWPSCDCVVSIPWADESRALWAIRYPGGPDVGGLGSRRDTRRDGRAANRARARAGRSGRDVSRSQGLSERASGEEAHAIADRGGREGASWCSRTREEGCIVIATSEGSIKFHEIWADRNSGTKRSMAGRGLLGGSDILESLHGVEKEGREVIR